MTQKEFKVLASRRERLTKNLHNNENNQINLLMLEYIRELFIELEIEERYIKYQHRKINNLKGGII